MIDKEALLLTEGGPVNEATGRERDLVLAPNQYAYILDETKGHVVIYVGPNKTSLANTDRPVVFNETTHRFEKANQLEIAIHEFSSADEGWYIVLENPAPSGKDSNRQDEHPISGSNNLPKLNYGKKINITGPVSFALWPGQVALVIQGHHLRSNQYLVVRVYNEANAQENWDKAVMNKVVASDKPAEETATVATIDKTNLTMGKTFVIRGTEVSFYIPPTGVEVVPDNKGSFVREAVSLERLEYCILLDEDGNKSFVKGPAVVFLSPTQVFVEKEGSRKFRALELNRDMGIYVKVIADYEEFGKNYEVGQELFITGADSKIYFPRSEHALIKYGDQEIHYAIAIPAGEARYVLNKNTGKVELVRGPMMFLPDPRDQVIVRRVLDPKVVELWFPGNTEAVEYNRQLMALTQGGKAELVTDHMVKSVSHETLAARGLAGEGFGRQTNYSPPRTITLNTKYDGAVAINVWTGYAVLVVSKDGSRRVEVGPKTILLEYDESLQLLTLSTGKPKTTDNLLRTTYLRVKNNIVSDIVTVQTQDLVNVDVKLSYRVNFDGEPTKWFDVENYVKFLTDHLRSLIRNAAKRRGIEEFNNKAIDIIRDTILGVSSAEPGKPRPGRAFEENGMRVYDVEVLSVKIGDSKIEQMLVGAQHSAVQNAITLASKEQELGVVKRTEAVSREIAAAKSATTASQIELQTTEVEKALLLALTKANAATQEAEARAVAELAKSDLQGKLNEAELARDKARQDQELALERARLEDQLKQLKAEVEGVVEKAKAISPDLVAALQAFGDKALAEKMAETMAPMALLGGNSIADVFAKLLAGTPLASTLAGMMSRGDGAPARRDGDKVTMGR